MAKRKEISSSTEPPRRGMSFRDALVNATGKQNFTASDVLSALHGKGYSDRDVARMMKGYRDISSNSSKSFADFVFEPDTGFTIRGGVRGSGKKKGNVKGFDVGDLIGLGNNVSRLAGALRSSLPETRFTTDSRSLDKSLTARPAAPKTPDFKIITPLEAGFDRIANGMSGRGSTGLPDYLKNPGQSNTDLSAYIPTLTPKEHVPTLKDLLAESNTTTPEYYGGNPFDVNLGAFGINAKPLENTLLGSLLIHNNSINLGPGGTGSTTPVLSRLSGKLEDIGPAWFRGLKSLNLPKSPAWLNSLSSGTRRTVEKAMGGFELTDAERAVINKILPKVNIEMQNLQSIAGKKAAATTAERASYREADRLAQQAAEKLSRQVTTGVAEPFYSTQGVPYGYHITKRKGGKMITKFSKS